MDARGLHFGSRGMPEGSEGLVATQNPSPHFSEINQSLEEQDCHFLEECWEISLTINLSRLSCSALTFYQVHTDKGDYHREVIFVLYNEYSHSIMCLV